MHFRAPVRPNNAVLYTKSNGNRLFFQVVILIRHDVSGCQGVPGRVLSVFECVLGPESAVKYVNLVLCVLGGVCVFRVFECSRPTGEALARGRRPHLVTRRG